MDIWVSPRYSSIGSAGYAFAAAHDRTTFRNFPQHHDDSCRFHTVLLLGSPLMSHRRAALIIFNTSVLLERLYESSGGNQVDGLPPAQHFGGLAPVQLGFSRNDS